MTAFALRILQDDADHEAALDELERLWGAPDGSPEADRLGVLALIIDDYERRAHPLPLPDPIDAILFRMESQGLTRRDLARFIGSSGRISEVLSRKRGLSIEMIRRLHAGLGISLDVLVQPTGAPEAAEIVVEMSPRQRRSATG